MLKGFRDFLLRGNVIDLAVGVIIGAAFSAVVDSLVTDVVTPILGLFVGQPDFSAIAVGPVRIGNFLNALIAFLLKAAGLYMFIVVPYLRFFRRSQPMPPAEPPAEEVLLGEIRDILRQREVHPGPH